MTALPMAMQTATGASGTKLWRGGEGRRGSVKLGTVGWWTG